MNNELASKEEVLLYPVLKRKRKLETKKKEKKMKKRYKYHDNPLMILYEERLESFKYWFPEWLEIEDMAKAGFYYTGFSTDSTKCFECGLDVGGWNPYGCVGPYKIYKHIPHFSSCTYKMITGI